MRRSSYFTPHSVNAMLDELVARADAIRRQLQRARSLAAELDIARDDDERGDTMGRLSVIQDGVQEILDGIQERGVEIKGVQPLLLDFPAMRNGQEVYLCWKEGEGGLVQWWHPHHTGVKGRQRVDYDDLGCWEWVN